MDRRLEPKITSRGTDEEVPERSAIIDCELVACSADPENKDDAYRLYRSEFLIEHHGTQQIQGNSSPQFNSDGS